MTLLKLMLSLLLSSSFLFAYIDNDLDGVEDKYDQCPNTSFDALVDKYGCPPNEKYLGSLTLQIQNSWQFDTNNSFSNYGVALYYSYDNFSFSFSNAQQSTIDANNQTAQYTGDLYVDMGYKFQTQNLESKLSIGSKIATANENIGTGENDYYASFSLNYLLNNNFALFSKVNYTFVGDEPSIDYQNSLGYSVGMAYLLSDKWYSSLTYYGANSIYRDGVDYESLSWYNSYSLSSDYFLGLNYNYGLDELSFTHMLTLSLGATFE